MADQKIITLYPGDATPKDIVLRALPVADVATTTIYLLQGDATAKDIILRDPTVIPGVVSVSVVLAASEASDTAAAAVQLRADVALAASEGPDVAAVAVGLRIDAALAASEAADAASGTVGLRVNVVLAATEAADVGAGTAEVVNAEASLSMAASEAPDVAEVVADASIAPQFFGYGGPLPAEIERRKRDAEKHLRKVEAEAQHAAESEVEAKRIVAAARQSHALRSKASEDARWASVEREAVAAHNVKVAAERRVLAAQARYQSIVAELAEAQRQAAEDDDLEVLLLAA